MTKKKLAEQHQQFVDALKFTPIEVTLRIQGYGGEAYCGRVSRETYEFFKKNQFDIDEYASDWDGVWDSKIPRDLQPFPPGSPYECDSLFHASGAELSDSNLLEVEEVATLKTIWSIHPGYSELVDAGVDVGECGGTDLDDLDEGTVVFWGGQGEKGCFFEAQFTLKAPFDPSKLEIGYENCDGWYIINSIQYDGEELDGTGGYSTTGKWGENKWIIVGDEEVYESILMEDREEEFDPVEELEKIPVPESPKLTDWFDKDIKPTLKGTYEAAIDAEWPLSGIRMVEWTGRSWKEDGAKVKIKSWRGLAENPEA